MEFGRIAYSSLPTRFFCIIAANACADDGSIAEAGGTASLVKTEDTHIVMKSEVVTMTLDKDSYTVDATFEFFNEGDTSSLLVGFPRWGFNGLADDTMARSFETWVGGDRVTVRDLPGRFTILAEGVPRNGSGTKAITDPAAIKEVVEESVPSGVDLRWLAKDVTFEGSKTTTTRVRYKEHYRPVMCGCQNAHYMYGTGKSWKGNIGRAQFIVKCSPGMCLGNHPRYILVSMYRDSGRKPRFERAREGEYKYTLEDFEPAEDEVFILDLYGTDNSWETPWDNCNLFPQEAALKPVDREMLEVLPLRQLRLFRNAFFAVHGKRFEDTDLKTFFRTAGWYAPRDDFKEEKLTPLQRENVAKIAEAEKNLEKLCPEKNRQVFP